MEQIHVLMERNPSVLTVLLKTLDTEDANRQQTVANGWQTKGNMLLEVFSSNKQLVMRWQPLEMDIKVLIRMLLRYPRTHIFHKLSLGLLMHLNYGDSSRLYVSKLMQTRIAYHVVVAFRKHQPPRTDPLTAEQQTEQHNYQERCLFVLLQLRIHAFDQPLLNMRSLLEDPLTVEDLFLPAAAQLVEVQAGINEQCPVACLCALLSTTMGHWVPVFCQDGTKALSIMYELHHLDTVVVRCVQLITLLFLDCPLALANNVRFITMLTQLVENDDMLDWSRQTAEEQHQQDHIFATKLLEATGMGKMGAMLVSQVAVYWRLGYATPPSLVCMWFDCFVQIHHWERNAKVLRLMNVLAAISFGHADAWHALTDRFRVFFRSLSVAKQKQQTLWSKIVGTDVPLLYGTLPSDCVVLALLVFGVEHKQLEVDTELWPKLLRTLKKNRTIKIDGAVREVIGTLGLQLDDFCPAPDSLVLFKVARFLVRANIEHPLYLGLCQLFFVLLLTRVTDVGDEVHGVADRLYDYDTGLMEKVKQMLCKLELHYHCLQDTNEEAKGMLR
uniref:Epg5-like TPR domain-containing protein n=1 Tax=Anopheles maculatus TaxID=74869 RepID=A0A182T9V1_9DIPT